MDIKMDLSQNITLSQKMIQSMEILRMSAQELENFLENQALENPVIDIEEPHWEAEMPDDMQTQTKWAEKTDEQNRIYMQEENELLEDFLLSQLLTAELTPREYALIEYMVLSLDSRGYFTDDLKEAAERFCVSLEMAEDALMFIQQLEPAGVGARNLSECLLLQLKRTGRGDSLEAKVAESCLLELGKNKLPAIAKKLGVRMEEVKEACSNIRSLNPKPGNSFCSGERLKYIIPDVIVVKQEERYEIQLNEYGCSKIRINNYYCKMIEKNKDNEVKDYLSRCLKHAEWIEASIKQRSVTLLRVAWAIVDNQDSFFSVGSGNIKPMKLLDIAKKLSVHESTVSRAVRDKYLQCDRGVFPMSGFFSSSVCKDGAAEGKTPEQIQDMIRHIIGLEDKKKPLSDRLIAERLVRSQIAISRRTVAKYREAARIPDACGRKSY